LTLDRAVSVKAVIDEIAFNARTIAHTVVIRATLIRFGRASILRTPRLLHIIALPLAAADVLLQHPNYAMYPAVSQREEQTELAAGYFSIFRIFVACDSRFSH
jgi:hypothetical protein